MRRIAAAFLVPCMACACSAPSRVDVVELGVQEAQAAMADGRCSSRSLTQAYLDRIAGVDDGGPRLNAVIELNPRALEDAAALDRERASGVVRGPLHGIPVLLKDNIDVAGLVNSAGSLALADHRPTSDAFIVARLREAGAVILGKTNLSEWANFRSTRSTSGWSSRGGQTRNPYSLDRSPCGSSAGTGAAIAASLATVGVGTETDGSIICPASMNCLVGVKPTVGLVSRTGIIPISISQDTAGPMGRTVRDVAILMNAIVAPDPVDPAGAASAGHRPVDYTSSLRTSSLEGKRIGVLRQAMGYHPGVDALMAQAIDAVRSQGAVVVDVTVPNYGAWNEHEITVLLHEFKDGLDRYLQHSGAQVASLQALIEWNRLHADAVMPHFGQELLELAQSTGALTDAAYIRARDEARRLAGKDGLLAALEADRLDAVIAPSTSPAWMIDPVLGDHFVGAGYAMAAVAGTPSLTVPMGDVAGLPVGLTWMGAPFAEPDLLGFAYAFEQATAKRRAPGFIEAVR